MAKIFTLYDPKGNKYETGDKTEAVRLKAHGYTETKPKSAASKSDTK